MLFVGGGGESFAIDVCVCVCIWRIVLRCCWQVISPPTSTLRSAIPLQPALCPGTPDALTPKGNGPAMLFAENTKRETGHVEISQRMELVSAHKGTHSHPHSHKRRRGAGMCGGERVCGSLSLTRGRRWSGGDHEAEWWVVACCWPCADNAIPFWQGERKSQQNGDEHHTTPFVWDVIFTLALNAPHPAPTAHHRHHHSSLQAISRKWRRKKV